MTFDQQNADLVLKTVGKRVLWIGNECRDWTLNQFANAGRYARNLGFDSICAKRLNGTQEWYGTKQHLSDEYSSVTAAGCGYIPMSYSYGPAYGLDFVDRECDLLIGMQQAIGEARGSIGFVCADLETEYDGRVDAAQRFAAKMGPGNDLLFLTSWADPAWQGWSNVLSTLRECINAYIPQIYSDMLDTLEKQQIPQDLCVLAGLDLTQEFGRNDQVFILHDVITRGIRSYWGWEYEVVASQRQLVTQLNRMMNGV